MLCLILRGIKVSIHIPHCQNVNVYTYYNKEQYNDLKFLADKNDK